MMWSGRFEYHIRVLLGLCVACWCNGYTPPDNYLIDCGSPANTSMGNRVFIADNSDSDILSPNNIVIAITTSESINSPIYQTARIFTECSTYTFSIGYTGRHWIRLYFFPFVYEKYNMSTAKFSVSTQTCDLLVNFQPKSSASFEEFSVNVRSNTLVLTFTPMKNSFAFLNGLEVVSIPDKLITDEAKSSDSSQSFKGLITESFETVARVNMGGSIVSTDNDTLSRTWVPGDKFLTRPSLAKNVSNIAAVKYIKGGATMEIAPSLVYGTATSMNSENDPSSRFNVTWEFDVSLGFRYFVRFHFCDVISTGPNQLYFNVYLDSWLVASNLDLYSLTSENLAAPYYLDFVTPSTTSVKIRVSVGPSTIVAEYPNAVLNGLEIMKIVNLVGTSSVSSSSSQVGVLVGLIIGVVALLCMAILLVVLWRSRMRNIERQGLSNAWIGWEKSYTNGTSSTDTNLGYRFPFSAVHQATSRFDESLVIGVGGFGKVYKGVMGDGTKVAVKRGNPQSQQGLTEFETEIKMLSQFRHRHLVSLIGYCDEKKELILIYEYMVNGTLKEHLYGTVNPALSWMERLEACIGAARGLHYLHTGYSKAVIHRDVKSANILLDENLMAKVADFGLSKTGPGMDQTHVSTVVKGSFGYLDPEYFRRQHLTEKSDVYSFGVVLFEAICGRPVIDPSLPREEVNLAEWAMKWQKKGMLEYVVDKNILGEMKTSALRKFGETAEKCLSELGVDRPAMGDVLWNLEYALQLQEAGIEVEMEENSTKMMGELSPVEDARISGEGQFWESTSPYGDMSSESLSRIFSGLVKSGDS